MHYNYHRYYDPTTGRYLTPDPIGLAGGINLFAYVLNDPVNYFDPLGLHKKSFYHKHPKDDPFYYKKQNAKKWAKQKSRRPMYLYEPSKKCPPSKQECRNKCVVQLTAYIVIGSHLVSTYDALLNGLSGALDVGTAVDLSFNATQITYSGADLYSDAEGIAKDIDKFFNECMEDCMKGE